MNSIRLLSIILAIFFFNSQKLHAQVKNYNSQWKNVDELIQKKNLPKSALAEVKKIYTQAKKEGQETQVIKALVYMTGLQEETREENYSKSILEIENEIRTSKEPAASILKSMLAGLYWQYLQNNRWKFYDRTNTVNFNKNDIATWTLDDIHKKISELFLASIKNEKTLQSTRLDRYEAIINKGNKRSLRPTLYDLLANRALEYFKNDEADIKKPAYAFEIIQPQAFATAPVFARFSFNTRDSFSLQHKALEIYQKLIAFHLKDKKADALIDIDINRVEFVYNKSVAEDKDSLYLASLQSMIDLYKGHAGVKQAQYLIALWYENKASNYTPFSDTTFRYYRVKARDILTKIVKDSTIKNEGWTNSYNLLQSVEARTFSFELEKVNLPLQPFRSLVHYRNINSLYFRIIRVDENLKKLLKDRNENEAFWALLLKTPSTRSWQQKLPATNDLQDHAVEIKIDSLPAGEYYLLASPDAKFETKKNPLGARKFHVSNISYINRKENFFVLNRQSGQPLVNASATVYKQDYNYKTSKYEKKNIGTFTTDKNGYFKIAVDRENAYNNYFIELTHGNDHLDLDESTYGYYYHDYINRQQDSLKSIFFFTDRGIYRPGQTVYFKGIAISTARSGNAILPNFTTTIYLTDANYQYIDSVKVTTNEFGSFNAKFVLPQNTMNGNFQLVDKKHSVQDSYFSVEDYKRPKFFVEFEKISKAYKAGEQVTVTGSAKAYAGNNIDGAKVSYRVVREPRFIYTWYFSKWWMPPTEEMEIAHGETTTDKDGKFSISFTAIPDKTIDPKFDPVFDYRIYADVTDINGETRSNENIVTAGYKSLLLKASVLERMAIDSLKTLSIRTENMNGEFQPVSVKVEFNQLQPEQRLIRERFWNRPDQFIYSKEEYIRLFPHDEYDNETDKSTWKKEYRFSVSDSVRTNGEFPVNPKNLKPGFYEITITTKDKDGKEIKELLNTELFDPKTNGFNKPEYIWTKGSQQAIEPGESTTVQVGTSADQVFLINETDRPKNWVDDQPNIDKIRKPIEEVNNQPDFRFAQLDHEKRSFAFSATEEDRGSYGVAFFFVKDNRFYQFSDRIIVPWTNKELEIEYATFRDKTLPGSEEKWKVKIKGYKNEKVAAEMLASMYDASLDQFRMHNWTKPLIWPQYYSQLIWNGEINFQAVSSELKPITEFVYRNYEKQYDELMLDINSINERNWRYKFGQVSRKGMFGKLENVEVQMMKVSDAAAPNQMEFHADGVTDSTMMMSQIPTPGKDSPQPLQVRRNFNETAFFFPELRTDKDGNIEFSFTTPEALTKWKLQTFAHTKDLAFGLAQKELVTQKELMVQPNMPRFLRQGDKMELSVKIVNLSATELTGQAELQLFDATTNQSVDGWFMNSFPNQYFTVAAGQSEVVKFPVQVPFQFSNALTWRVVARSGNFSDGEENILPILSNKILVTETMPLPVRGSDTKTFNFEKLLQSESSPTLQHHALTVEYTSNPAWYAVQALPYLMEYPYDCAEQIWNRYYANALAMKIANAAPRIKSIFERWKTLDTTALLFNLQKNQELKSALLEETPWVMQAKSETEQKKNIALLFDLVRMSAEMEANLAKLKDMQSSNGGFVWFKGGPDDRYITQYILTGIGHLKNLGVDIKELQPIVQAAIPYLDKKIKEDHDQLIKNKADLKKQQLSYSQVQYLYMRSFFNEMNIPQASKKAFDFYRQQASQFWMKQNHYMQGMIALALYRFEKQKNIGQLVTPRAILASLKESSISNEELGMYWKDQRFGYSWFWYHAPIETQALMIEAFHEITKDTATVDDLRTWLIKNKQTNNWRTTKATAEACYAMLLQGTEWISSEPLVEIRLGSTIVSSQNQKQEAGTGYFKETIEGQKVKPEMGKITVHVQQPSYNSRPSWGSVYWQYFEDMDKVSSAATPLQLNKKLFIEKNTDRGPVLVPITESSQIKVGDKIKVRIELRVDRDMEYVHMKDMRASALEPVNVLSGYKWQDGLGYYESTRDASTNFFFSYLRKGSYVFEYPLFATHAGSFSNGITTIQCMYAPEFSAHSEGIKIEVE